MRNNNRNSVINIIENLSWGTHFCQLYQIKEDLMDIVLPYLKAGLDDNEFCIWITSENLNAEEAKEALRIGIPDIDLYLKKGQIELISHTNWYTKNDIFDSQRALDSLVEKMNKSLTDGYNGLRLVENISWLEKESWNNFVNYEKRMDSITGRSPMRALCTYSLGMCSAANIIDIVANHQFALVKKGGKWERIESSGRKNITECERAEQGLRESEARYRMLFTNITEGFYLAEVIYNKDGKPHDYRYLEINPAYELITGITKEQILGKSIREVFSNVDHTLIEKLGEVALSGKSTHFEVFSRQVNKHFEGYVFRPEKGKIAVIFRDISGRKRAEEALHASEARYRSLYENSPDGILLTRPDGTILSANPQACNLHGMTEDEIIQLEREGLVVNDNKLAAALKERELTGRMKAELTCRRKDGSTFACDVTSNLFTDSDGSIMTSMIIRDVTERKRAEEALRKSEEHYRMLFANMTEGFGLVEVIYDHDGKPYDYRYLEINPAFELYLGLEREKMLGKTMLEMFPNVSPIAIERYNEAAFSGKSTHFEIFSQVANKYLEIYTFSPEKGKLALILRDITERKAAEAKLQETLDNLEKLVHRFQSLS